LGQTGKGLVEGTVVVIDLDKFEQVVAERGWSEYEPNPATALLTELVKAFTSKWSAYVVYGLDEERGTEEAVIEVPFTEPDELLEDLREIKRRINGLGVGVTIVAVKGYVGLIQRTRNRRAAYKATPTRRYALRLLRNAKRKGGNIIVVA